MDFLIIMIVKNLKHFLGNNQIDSKIEYKQIKRHFFKSQIMNSTAFENQENLDTIYLL